MSDAILDRIVAATVADLRERQAVVPLDALRERAAAAPAPRDFAAALRPTPVGPARLMAEVKRASPSRGLLAPSFDPVAQARAYAAGGAAAISVLTEPHFFEGSLDHLSAARAAVALPVLRKDFILDPYQVYDARAAGADAVLLICSLLDDAQLADLLGLTRALGMEALVEAHDAVEVRRAVAAGAQVIGVNSRDLRTFAVDTDIVRHLRPLVPDDRIFVAESGITSATDAARARAWGADTILVGEALMRAGDPAATARELATAPGGGAVHAFFAGAQRPFVKICGLATPEQVRAVARLGADAYGLVFAPQAPDHRRLTADQAAAIVDAAWRDSRAADGQPVRPVAVGVFVNEPPATVAAIARRVGLGAVQLSGDEAPGECAAVARLAGIPVIKALRPRDTTDLARLDDFALAGAIPHLDTPVPGAYGGTGETGDWSLAHEAARRWPVLLSGGLTPDNVADAIHTVHPRGVDVSSGVESTFAAPLEFVSGGSPAALAEVRAKDPDEIARFISSARNAQPSTDPRPAGHRETRA